MKSVAIIPARGGSKRLPRKNIIDFHGKPVIAYTIEAAASTSRFDRVVVSTEDEEIAEIAQRFGADVEPRPEDLATDTATVVQVCEHVLLTERERGTRYDVLCCLYATAPLRTADDIKAVMDLVVDDPRCDYAMAVTEFDLPVNQALTLGDDGLLRAAMPDLLRLRQNDVPKFCVDNGSTYVARASSFLQSLNFYGEGLTGYLMPRARSVDIDNREDLELALWHAKRSDFASTR